MMTGCRIALTPTYKRRGRLTCVVPPEVPERGAAAPSVEIDKASADSTGVLVAVTRTRLRRARRSPRTAGCNSLHADSRDLIQGTTCKGQPCQRRVPKYQGQGLNPVWDAKRQKREKEKSLPYDVNVFSFQSHQKQHWTTLSIFINLSKAPEILTQILVSVRLGQEHSWSWKFSKEYQWTEMKLQHTTFTIPGLGLFSQLKEYFRQTCTKKNLWKEWLL